MTTNRTYCLKWDLYFINGISLLLIGVIATNQAGVDWLHAVRVVLGLPFILFFPGYALIAALFPGQKALDGLERVALSFGLSIAVVPLLGLGLNYTPWGIRLTPILISLMVFTLLLSAAAFLRRRKLPEEEVYYPVLTFSVPNWSEMGRVDRILSAVLVLAILFAVGSIVYVVSTPKTGEKFTEFYILGPGGKAAGYPRNLAPGQPGDVIVGVVNHEYVPVSYYVEIKAGGWLLQRTAPFQVAYGKKWERNMSFLIRQPHQKLEVEFLLFRQGDKEPYRSLHLWVDVAPGIPVAPRTPAPVNRSGNGRPSTSAAVSKQP